MMRSALRLVMISTTLVACAAGGTTGTPDARDASIDAAQDTGVDVVFIDHYEVQPARCGDGMCSPGENCMTCPLDCNRCPTCDMAPSCTGALAVPTTTMPLMGCDNTTSDGTDRTNYACGTGLGTPPDQTTCADPKLRVRVQQITLLRGTLDVPRQFYCAITAEDGMHSELLLTPPRDAAGNRMTTMVNLPLSASILWGQGDLYRSISNLTITYACYLTSDGAAAQRALDDIANRATMASQHADGYGWVFGTVAVLSTVLGSSLSNLPDTQILDVQQTISSGALLTMTNGRTWDIHRRSGDLNLSGAWDIHLAMESWGCADVRRITP